MDDARRDPRLLRSPRAETFTVNDLLEMAEAGNIRIPAFQRGLKWSADDVELLFDSIWRGYPVGALLLWVSSADAGTVSFGDCLVRADASDEAYFVVDGQQRLDAILGTFLGEPEAVSSKYRLYFDLKGQRFLRPSRSDAIQEEWIPVASLRSLDSVFQWLDGNAYRRAFAVEARRVFTTLSEYRIPAYLVRGEGAEKALREIFARMNRAGRAMKEEDVFRALYHASENPDPIEAVQSSVATVGIGIPERRDVLSVLKALAGLDISKSFDRQRDGGNELVSAASDPVSLVRASRFLRDRCGVRHVRVVPYTATCLVVVAEFFRRFPQPQPRNLVLLTRWFWRLPFLDNAGSIGARRALLKALSCPDLSHEARSTEGQLTESEAVQALLSVTDVELPTAWSVQPFDARTAISRVEASYLASLVPHAPNSLPIDLGSLFDERGADAFTRVVPSSVVTNLSKTVANRVLWPGTPGNFRTALLSEGEEFCVSHGIDERARAAARDGNWDEFLITRQATLGERIGEFVTVHAGDGLSDRPPIASMVGQ